MEFKVGDLVRCVDVSGSIPLPLKLHNIYTIEGEEFGKYIRVVGVNRWFTNGRFKKLEKVNNTRLARKMYPKAEVDEDGMLVIEC
jgi:hypothetical protein